MQFIEFTDESVRVYHTRIEHQSTPQFECGGLVPLAECTYISGPHGDGSTWLLVPCSGGCGAAGSAPLTGGADAQRLHARKRHADPAHPAQTPEAAIESVLADVTTAGGLPSIELAKEGLECCPSGVPDATALPLLHRLHVQLEEAKAAEAVRQQDAAQLEAAKLLAELGADTKAALLRQLTDLGVTIA